MAVISTLEASESGAFTVILQPNGSLSWTSAKGFFAATVVIAATIALFSAVNGWWLVLPWTALELATLGAALYLVQRENERREVITVDETSIVVEGGRRQCEWRQEFSRTWAQVSLKPAPIRGHPSTLTLRSRGSGILLGRFLNNDEREELSRMLTKVIRAS